MAENQALGSEFTPSEKLWLLAAELLRDEGATNVTSHHLASLLGQTLACVAIHETVEPLDSRTMKHILDRANAVAMELHGEFIEMCRSA
jgi:hypothetical protein